MPDRQTDRQATEEVPGNICRHRIAEILQRCLQSKRNYFPVAFRVFLSHAINRDKERSIVGGQSVIQLIAEAAT